MRGAATAGHLRLVEMLWRRAYPAIQRLGPADLPPLLSWFDGSKRTKIVATVDALTHFDMAHEAARLGTKISPLVVWAYANHGGEELTR